MVNLRLDSHLVADFSPDRCFCSPRPADQHASLVVYSSRWGVFWSTSARADDRPGSCTTPLVNRAASSSGAPRCNSRTPLHSQAIGRLCDVRLSRGKAGGGSPVCCSSRASGCLSSPSPGRHEYQFFVPFPAATGPVRKVQNQQNSILGEERVMERPI